MKKLTTCAAVILATSALATTGALAQSGQQGQQSQQMQAETVPLDTNEQAVRWIQQELNKRGYNAGSVDGLWGPMTEGALRNFQQAQGIDPTGELDTRTVNALGMSMDELTRPQQAQKPQGSGQRQSQ